MEFFANLRRFCYCSAAAPVIKAKDESIATAISVIFFFNILAALFFPHLGSWLGLSNEGFAIFAGTAVNDTSSVTATASSWDSLHGTSILEQATIVKLTFVYSCIHHSCYTWPIYLAIKKRKIEKEVIFSHQSCS
ncbi:MAG: putative sulfate exporter family transporter [Streptococcus sp.]|uniref:putative sulfate exporter family transporter n=1 Tax=Streptococcus sp. TaxID=1306 RepID=UPI0039968277